MKILRALLVLLLLSGAAYAAEAQGDSPAAAEKLLDAGEHGKAEAMLKRLIQADPKKAELHQLLGDVHKRQNRLKDALDEYEKARGLGAENAELYKSIGTVNKWLGNTSKAEQAYNKALKINPNDREAKDDIKGLKQGKGLKLSLMAGGWEPDNTKSKFEVMVNYKGIEKTDAFAGYSDSDNVTYKRKKMYGGFYYFYDKGDYFKASAYHKDYDYPTGGAVQPDANAYDKVPGFEVELSHWFTREYRGTVAFEYFRPNFLYDSASKANNYKISGEFYFLTEIDWLRGKVMYAWLKDPDSSTTLIKGRTCLGWTGAPPVCTGGYAAATEIHYQTQSLLGAGIEVEKGKWSGELKYMPNRDLDSSYKSSIFAAVGYKFNEKLDGRFDYLYDKYSSKSAYAGQTAKIYLFSGFYKLDQATDLGVGVKFINQPAGNDTAAFATVSYKVGL